MIDTKVNRYAEESYFVIPAFASLWLFPDKIDSIMRLGLVKCGLIDSRHSPVCDMVSDVGSWDQHRHHVSESCAKGWGDGKGGSRAA